jgi:hypothetical protein
LFAILFLQYHAEDFFWEIPHKKKNYLINMVFYEVEKYLAGRSLRHTVNPALLTSSFVWQIQLFLLKISLFKEIKRKYFSQGKCEFMIFLIVLLDKIKILTLETVYLPH